MKMSSHPILKSVQAYVISLRLNEWMKIMSMT